MVAAGNGAGVSPLDQATRLVLRPLWNAPPLPALLTGCSTRLAALYRLGRFAVAGSSGCLYCETVTGYNAIRPDISPSQSTCITIQVKLCDFALFLEVQSALVILLII